VGDFARLLVAILLLPATAGCQRQEPVTVDTSLCAILSAPASFDGKKVRIRSRLESDATHFTVLSDPSCKGRGIVLRAGAAKDDARVRALMDAVIHKAEHPGTLDKEVTATFTGVFRWRKAERPALRLELLDVTGVVIEPRSNSPFAALSFVDSLTRELYVYPLGLGNPMLRIEEDPVRDREAMTGFVVHVRERVEWAPPELLTVRVVRVRGHLQYVSASGPALEGPAPTGQVLEYRREAAVRALQALGGYSTDGKEHRSTRPGFVELRFTHPDPPPHLFGTATAVFHQRSGILTMFGTPAVPPE
jgi:hypothetical protein